MMFAMPSVAEERLMAVGAPTRWKSFALFPRIGFFILSTICSAALFGFVALVFSSGHAGAVFAGLMAIGAAELLIGWYHFFAAGLEEALWFVGINMVIGGCIPYSASWRVWLLLFGIASLVAAVRLLNPLCAVLGVVLAAFVLQAFAAPFCALVAFVSLALLPMPRRRPSLEHALAALAVAMPAAAYLFARGGNFEGFSPMLAAGLLLYAILALVLGLRFRLHAPLLALFPTLGCFAYEVRDLSGLSLEARLIVWGSVLLGASIAIERVLRTPRNGLTSRQLKDDKLGDLLQLAGTVAVAQPAGTHHAAPDGGPRVETGAGSSFGGAGAGGDF